jgi:phage-related protein
LDSEGSAEELYVKSYNFILTRFNYDKSKILDSKEGEKLIFEHLEDNLISYKTLISNIEMDVRFQIRLDFRDNRFKWEVTALEGFFENDLFNQNVQDIIR